MGGYIIAESIRDFHGGSEIAGSLLEVSKIILDLTFTTRASLPRWMAQRSEGDLVSICGVQSVLIQQRTARNATLITIAFSITCTNERQQRGDMHLR